MAEASHKQDPSAALSDPLCGRVLNGRFSILEPIGSGGMGKVYRAIQAPLDRMVAIKILHPQFSNNRDPGFVKRFVLEASLTSKLRHPNTVTVIDYGQTEDGIFYIAMEYLEGQSLAEVLLKQGALPWQRALHIGQQVCRSLREAHRFGIIHRDLKPANVMLLDEADHDLVKVLDFGLVKSFVGDGASPDAAPDSKITQAGMLLGSPQYMSPEQARNHSDPRSDVYSFGVLLYEMITGQPPFTAKDYLEVIVKHLKEQPPSFLTMRPDLSIPVEVEDLVLRCLEKDPTRRFQSMDEVLEALRALGVGSIQASFGGDSRASGSQPGIAAGLASVTPRPDGQSPFTPAPESSPGLPPGTPPPYARQMQASSHAPGSSPGLPRHGGSRAGSNPGLPPAHGPRVLPGATPLAEEPKTEAVLPAGDAGGNVFSVSHEQGGNRMALVAAGIALALILGGGGYMLSRPKSEPGATPPAAAAAAPAPAVAPQPATPAPAPTAAAPAGKPVKFRVMTEPSKAQVFMGAKAMGETPVEFEVPADKPDGTVTIDLVLILDGYYPLPVTAGGSGVVLITQRMQKRAPPPVASPGGRRGGKRAQLPIEDPYDARIDAPELIAEAPLVAMPPPKAEPAQAPEPPTPVAAAPPPAPTPAPAPAVGGPTSAPTAAQPPGVVQFDGERMSRPQILEKGKPLQYTPEALRARVEGLMIVKCVIATNGKLERCRFFKTLPYMEKAVLEALQSRTYKPLTLEGKPVAVDYTFEVKLKLPTEL